MSKSIRIKALCTIEFNFASVYDPDDVREICDLDPFEAIENEHIKIFMEEQDIDELINEVGVSDFETVEVFVR